jgi:hypothetical protein
MAAGGCAGVAVEAILFPLDTIKTRLQVREVYVWLLFHFRFGFTNFLGGFTLFRGPNIWNRVMFQSFWETHSNELRLPYDFTLQRV